jgi:low affinity Fe/Cu permease
MHYRKTSFSKFAAQVSHWAGHPSTFLAALLLIVLWLVSGPLFHFSDTWQLVINTGTTIVTFLMVFLIQNTQNRETYAIHLKLDELIRCIEKAHNSLLDLEELDEAELLKIRRYYIDLAKSARKHLKSGKFLPEVKK